jgi:hypothetical protein
LAFKYDAKGSETYNQGLSERRADAVKQFLSEKYGIDARNLVTVGYGLKQLKDPPNPFAAENRRVQVVNASDKQAALRARRPLKAGGDYRSRRFCSVPTVRFAQTVLHGPAILAAVERLESRSVGAIESAASTIAVAIPVPVTRAVVVPVAPVIIAIATRPITAQVQIDSLCECRHRHGDNRGRECE